MPYKIADDQAWEDLKSGVLSKKNTFIRDIPKRLHVVRSKNTELSNILDLHGQTVQQAFDTTLNFLSCHYRVGSREVLIITGRGTMGQGLIKKEFDGWLNHPKIQKYVRSSTWQNRGGAVKIFLKKKG